MRDIQRIERIIDQERTAHGLDHLTGKRPEELITRHLSASGLMQYLETSTDVNERAAHRYLGMGFKDLHQSTKPVFESHFEKMMDRLERSPAALHAFLDTTVSDPGKSAQLKAQLGSSDSAERAAARSELKSYLAAKIESDPSALLQISEQLAPFSTEVAAKLAAASTMVAQAKNQIAASLYTAAPPSPHLSSPNPVIQSLLDTTREAIEKHPILTAVAAAAAVNALLDSQRQREDDERRALLKILDEKEASNARVSALEGQFPELEDSGALSRYKSSDPRVILTLAAASEMANKAQLNRQKREQA